MGSVGAHSERRATGARKKPAEKNVAPKKPAGSTRKSETEDLAARITRQMTKEGAFNRKKKTGKK